MSDGAADPLEVSVLGTFEVTQAGRRIAVRGATERALLARLALDGNRPVSNSRIVDDIWGERAPRQPKQAIHALVFRLRQALGDAAAALATSDRGYSLRLAADALDLWRFEALVVRGRAAHADGDLDAAARHLTGALAVWRGDALAGLDDHPFVPPRARQLGENRFETLVERIEVNLARGQHGRLVPELEALLVQRPTHEGLCRLLMTALYRCGRQVDALAAYDRLRKRLAGEFGIDPSGPLQELEIGVLRQNPRLDWRAPPVRASGSRAPGHGQTRGRLPHPFTSFIGRKEELAEAIELVGRHRLVTVAGPGGCGKTRLAIAAGHRLAGEGVAGGPREVRFVRLEGLSDLGLVPVAVAEALGVRLGGGPSVTSELAAALTGQDVLVILDNCEHVLQPCVDLVMAVLEAAADARFLLTSREPLSVPGEVVWRLPSLAAPGPDDPPDRLESAEAVRLFLDRAAVAVGPAGPPGRAELPTVAEVCRRLDGIPLAIELAAARLGTLSLEQLAQRLADCFAVLDTGFRAVLPRHRTLQAAMAWSYDLLDEQERCLFRRLAVFASAFGLDAAEVVCAGGAVADAEVCDLLARLAAKSLVSVERDEGEVEYRLLNTIREYAGSLLVDAAERREVARRHHDWCLSLATEAAKALHDGDQRHWAHRMSASMDDIRAALEWALAPDRAHDRGRGRDPGGRTVRLATHMWQVWEQRGQYREGRQWIERALARDACDGDGPRQERASLLLGAAVLARGTDDYAESHRFFTQAQSMYRDLGDAEGAARCRLELGRLLVVDCQLELARACAAEAREQYRRLADDLGVAWADVLAGNVLMARGDYGEAAEILGGALRVGRRLDNPFLVAETLVFLGLVAARSGRADEAVPFFEEALGLARSLGSEALINVSLANLGVVAGQRGEHGQALALLDEALAMARRRGEPIAIARILVESGEIASQRGEHVRSQALAREALRVCRSTGTFSAVPQCLGMLARAALSGGQIPRAATLLGAADRARGELGLATPDPDSPAGLRRGNQEWRRAWQQGAQLSMADAIGFALDEA